MGLEDLFSTEILRWRYARSLGCTVLLQTVLCTTLCKIYSTLVVERVWHPFTWSTLLFHAIIKPRWIINLILPIICIILLTRVHIPSYKVKPWLPRHRWDYIKRLMSPSLLLATLTVVFSSCLLIHYYAGMAHQDFHSLVTTCTDQSSLCINHRSLLIALAGIYYGIRFSINYFINNGNLVNCSAAQPGKLTSIKGLMNIRLIRTACATHGVNISSLMGILIFYILFGGIVSAWVSALLGVSTGAPRLGGLLWVIVLDVQLLIVLTLSSILLAVLFTLFLHVFNMFITERLEMPISGVSLNETEEESSWRLCHGLVSSCDLLQLLAFQDLHHLTASNTWDPHRRSQLFAISQPGGHPRNWMGVMNPSLNLIRKFTDKLKRHNCPEDCSVSTTTTQLKSSTDVNKNEVTKTVTSTLKEKFQKMIEAVKRLPIICYFLADLPQYTNRQIFAESQPVIWAVQGLADVVSVSCQEDKYGVVQRNIPDILEAIVHLHQVLDKVSRVALPRRGGGNITLAGGRVESSAPPDVQLRRALRLALRSSLYNITTTFGDAIREVSVSPETRNKLQSYLEFKEG